MHDLRSHTWSRLHDESFDLVIIGAGVIGAAAARDAALRGLKVAVVDANDTAAGTSSRSSKLVHGGLRYLEQREFSLVFESVSERRVLLDIAPHLVRPAGFLFPIYPESPVTVAKLRLGLMVYEGLALFRSPRLHRTLSARQATKDLPQLRAQGLKGAPLYWDCMTDDARLTLEVLLDAQGHGAAVLTYGKVTGLVRDDNGRVSGVTVLDGLDDGAQPRTVDIRARAVINATGPWSDRVRGLSQAGSNQLRCTKGVHIVVPADRLQMAHVVVGTHPKDKRVLFVIPWGDSVYIGTTDTDYEGDPREVAATTEDVQYLLDAANAYFPSVALRPQDVTSTWAGLRPLIRADGLDPSDVSREHTITVDPDGLISIAGGKLTTCRRMGAEVVQRALDWITLAGRGPLQVATVDTGRMPLPGAVGWPADDEEGQSVCKLVQAAAGDKLPPATCRYLTDRYGTRAIDLVRLALSDQRLLQPLVPGRPEILAQVDWAVRHELALTVTDFMERRTQLFFRDRNQGLDAVDVVADRMAELLGWSADRRAASAEQYRGEVAMSRRWRLPPDAPGQGAPAWS
ncbi:glycerol-3-phosphate dehydrogenase/oxidase [Myxococcota bacterium]|nr:glycerol-3-phosphate dehydrogenase/oxidase [Myxococcota bacterium]